MKRALIVLSSLALVTLAACSNDPEPSGGSSGAVTVDSSDEACTLSATEAPSGTVSFEVTNSGSDVTEFYLLADDDSIVGEVENVGPGITRQLVVQVGPGSYVARCKPGMTGDGISVDFTVTGSDADAAPDRDTADGKALAAAVAGYHAYVRSEVAALVGATGTFAAAYLAGDHDDARAQYAAARAHWERIEPVAESFGDLDPKLDLREADLEPGQRWTGWHAIEKDLWPPAQHQAHSRAERSALAAALVADTAELARRVRTIGLTPAQLGNGAKELLDEVATGKVTGEEETWSHTDLWDFQANVDGAREAFEQLRPVVVSRDPELARTLDARFDEVQALLDRHRDGAGFVPYTQLTPRQVRELAAGVDALGEPLSRLTVTVVG